MNCWKRVVCAPFYICAVNKTNLNLNQSLFLRS
nr:MAG TPA: hypothetical protein [Caudoviricetes sp.]